MSGNYCRGSKGSPHNKAKLGDYDSARNMVRTELVPVAVYRQDHHEG